MREAVIEHDDKTLFQKSAEVSLLESILLGLEVGESIDYVELSERVGFDVPRHRSKLDRARKTLLLQHQIVFGSIRGFGIKRLEDSGIVTAGQHGVSRIARQARRTATTLACVRDFESLSDYEKTLHNTAMATAAVIESTASVRGQKLLANEIETANNRMPDLSETLALFQVKGK